jgi:hypothetical protein
MAHEIDFSTGAPAIAYVGTAPWHGYGEKLEMGQPIEAWLTAARLEWELKRLPVQYIVGGELKAMDNRFVLIRSDTEEALSVVSGDYHVVQPREILEFYRTLVHQYGYSLETAGALNGGRKVWALAKTGIDGNVGEDGQDRLAAYLLLATSCDKTLATTVAFTSIRVVCQNTLSFAANDVKFNKRLHLKVPHNRRFDAERINDAGLADCPCDANVEVRRIDDVVLNLAVNLRTDIAQVARIDCSEVSELGNAQIRVVRRLGQKFVAFRDSFSAFHLGDLAKSFLYPPLTALGEDGLEVAFEEGAGVLEVLFGVGFGSGNDLERFVEQADDTLLFVERRDENRKFLKTCRREVWLRCSISKLPNHLGAQVALKVGEHKVIQECVTWPDDDQR